jgi:protein SCO1/2
MRRAAIFAVVLLWPVLAFAALSPAALNSAGVFLPANARLPLTLSAADISGRRETLSAFLAGRPGFVLFADYTCKTLCGPALVLLGNAVAQSGLPPDSYRIIVLGLDPKDLAADARRMEMTELPREIQGRSSFLLPDSGTLAAATMALGFHYVYDKSVDQFAHPEVAYAVAADGRVLRVLSPLTLTASEITGAFSDGPASRQGLYQRFRVLCYRFGVLSGIYDGSVELALKAAAVLTLAGMGAALFFLLRRKSPAWR